MKQQSYDVIIVGGGVMGCSTAYHLMKADPSLSVLILEKDPSYERASSTLSMSNARIQFSLLQNVQISQYAIEILENFERDMELDGTRPSISYHQEGNLFLIDESNRDSMRCAFDMQATLGCQVEWWDPEQVKEHYPLYNPQGYLAGTFGPKDGHFDAYAVLMAYRAKARALGAQYLPAEVAEIQKDALGVTGVRLVSGESISGGVVVNCAGAWCNQVLAGLGICLPVEPTQRQIFAVDSAQKPEGPLPLTILPSGLYFRTETGGLLLIGKSTDQDRVGIGFDWDPKRFTEELWPELWEFVPAFDRLKLMRGWAGLYAENTFDGNAILGEWPELKGCYLCNGFSGHGLQQSPAVGRYMSELILGRPLSLDLSIFAPQRLLEDRPIDECGLV